MKTNFYKLMLVTQKGDESYVSYLAFLKKCIEGGITAVELREKSITPVALLRWAHTLKAFLKPFKIPLIINDSLDVAKAVDAEGLHLGQKDGNIEQTRKNWEGSKILGLSVSCLKELLQSNDLPVDYVGIGPFYPTKNKPEVRQGLGPYLVTQMVKSAAHPTVAIGGVTVDTIKTVAHTGVDGVAIIGAFHDQKSQACNTAGQLKQVMEMHYVA